MLEFLNDKNKWVKLSAYLNLGKFFQFIVQVNLYIS